MAKIFISYARADGYEHAHEIANQLRALKHEVFLDVQGIPGGVPWDTELTQSIQWCDILLVLMTPISNQSEPVYNEFRAAEINKKLIIPIQVDDTPFASYLKKYQAIPLKGTNYDAMLLRFVTAISEHEKRTTREQPVTISQLKQLEKENGNPTKRKTSLFLFIAITLIAIGIITGIFLVMNNNNNVGGISSDETQVAKNLTNTDVPDTQNNIPTANNTPQITNTATQTRFEQLTATAQVRGTSTPRPTSTPRLPTNTPTTIPQEAILFEEDFEDNQSDVIQLYGNWEIIEDENGNHVYTADQSLNTWASAIFGQSNWQNYAIEADVRIIETNPQTYVFMIRLLRTIIEGGEYSYAIGFHSNIAVGAYYLPQWTFLRGFEGFQLSEETWYKIRVEVVDRQLRFFVDNVLMMGLDNLNLDSGGLGLSIGNQASVQFDNIRVWSISALSVQ
jgi:hypothetical protein